MSAPSRPRVAPQPARRRPSARDILLTAAVSAAAAPPQTFFYGGQAVVEGVLMRGPHHYAIAARRPDGSIAVCHDVLTSRVYTSSFWRLPFFRGVAGLIEMLHLGMRALHWSANVQLGEDIQLSPRVMRVTVGISFVFALMLIIGLPLAGGQLLHRETHSTVRILIEGLLRGGILLAYLVVIGLAKNIQRIFQYHGAEHKTINCLESGQTIDVEHVQHASRLHPRCGTGFLVVVAFVSIVVFTPLGVLDIWWRLLLQVLLVPVVAGISYECIRALARVRHTWAGRIALAPILATQLLSTRQPDAGQMEVAITALQAARREDGDIIGEPHDPTL